MQNVLRVINNTCPYLCKLIPHAYQKQDKGWTKKNNPNTFLVAVGLMIIVQQYNTTRWKRLDVSFQMIIEPFLCDEYFLRYHQKCKAEWIQ